MVLPPLIQSPDHEESLSGGPEPCGGLPQEELLFPLPVGRLGCVARFSQWSVSRGDKRHIQMGALRGIASLSHFCFPSAVREQQVPIFFLG